MKKVLLLTLLLITLYMGVYAQTVYEAKRPPMSTETEIGKLGTSVKGKTTLVYGNDKNVAKERRGKTIIEGNSPTEEELHLRLLNEAKKKYGVTYPKLSLRNFKSKERVETFTITGLNEYKQFFDCSATVVIPDQKKEAYANLSQVIDKALRDVREGSRMAINQVIVISDIDEEDFKDQVVNALLDKGYKVVAKEYLEKLYEEQQAQQSGIYNERTTVQENNFSAVGYYINVKVTETSLRVQVINVSTGEYEGNATVNF